MELIKLKYGCSYYYWNYREGYNPRYEVEGSSIWHAEAQRKLRDGLNSVTNKNACDVLANYY